MAEASRCPSAQHCPSRQTGYCSRWDEGTGVLHRPAAGPHLIRNFQGKTVQWKNGESSLTLLLSIYDFCSLSIFAFIWCPSSMYSELCAVFNQRLAWSSLTAEAHQLTKKLPQLENEKPAILMKAQCCKEGVPKSLLWIFFWNQVSATTWPFPIPFLP